MSGVGHLCRQDTDARHDPQAPADGSRTTLGDHPTSGEKRVLSWLLARPALRSSTAVAGPRLAVPGRAVSRGSLRPPGYDRRSTCLHSAVHQPIAWLAARSCPTSNVPGWCIPAVQPTSQLWCTSAPACRAASKNFGRALLLKDESATVVLAQELVMLRG